MVHHELYGCHAAGKVFRIRRGLRVIVWQTQVLTEYLEKAAFRIT